MRAINHRTKYLFTLFTIAMTSYAFAEDFRPTDRSIGDAIKKTMTFDPAVFSNDVDVFVEAGIVTLEGGVGNVMAKQRAEAIAASKKGVRSVVNLLEVEDSGLSDFEIQSRIQTALSFDTVTRELPITPTVVEGVVTLTGEVDAWGVRDLAEDVASQVTGVRGVVDQLTIKPSDDRDPEIIQAQISETLNNFVYVDSGLLTVEVVARTAKLSGIVGSLTEKTQAIRLANVAGITTVDATDLKVDSWMASAERKKVPVPIVSDENIKKAVRAALVADPRVNGFKPEIAVENGHVSLTGVVNTIAAQTAAERDALNTNGVLKVNNMLEVNPLTTPVDVSIKTSISDALRINPYTDRYDVKIAIDNGNVTLTGNTGSLFEKAKVEEIASGIEGVRHITNNIMVKAENTSSPSVIKSDSLIYEDIRDELKWNPLVEAELISVEVKDGLVTLKGEVRTLAQRRAAETDASEGGARGIINDIQIIQSSN